MKRVYIVMGLLAGMLISGSVSAERLELGLAAGPNFVMDKNFEAFSSDNLILGTFGADVRTQVGSVSGFQFAPLFGYRFGTDSGTMYNVLDTRLLTHDFRLGLRVRKDIISWLTVFIEAHGGLLLGYMHGDLLNTTSYDDLGLQNTYDDKQVTWSAGGQIGLETHFSRAWLKSKDINRFCFGGEIGVGYSAHGDLKFDPTLSGGGDNAIETETLGAWGGVNTSGVSLQIAGSLYFF